MVERFSRVMESIIEERIMKIDIWKWMVTKDDFLLSLIEILGSVRGLYGLRSYRWRKIGADIIASRRADAAGKDVVIVLNGPSIKKQPLERLQGMDLVFVNQGFRHPAYKLLKPKYHVFIDSKMIHGTWDIGWLDEIRDMVPEITFVMPADWARLPLLQPYIEKNFSIIWTGGCIGGMRGLGVSGECFNLVQRLGYKRVFFTGFEATSFAASLLKESSHFYGNDTDEESMTASDIMKGYYMNARQIRELILVAETFVKNHVEAYNLTEGGLLNMFTRKKFDDVFPE